VVTNGTQQAVDLIARVLLATLGMDVVGVPVDAEGLVVEAVPPGTRMVLVTPSHQSPLQAALASFIDRGYLACHVRRMRAVYQEPHQRIVEVLGDRFTDRLKVIPSSAGLHVAATIDRVGEGLRRLRQSFE
jgi:DNA-binding transcriptional MocR family regulator